MRRGQHDLVGRCAQELHGHALDLTAQVRLRGRLGLAGLRHDHQTFGPADRVGAAEDGDTTLADAGQVANGLLQFMGIDIAPGTNDQVFDTPGQVHVSGGDIGEIPGVQPGAVD